MLANKVNSFNSSHVQHVNVQYRMSVFVLQYSNKVDCTSIGEAQMGVANWDSVKLGKVSFEPPLIRT